jgi:hypothetical protein
MNLEKNDIINGLIDLVNQIDLKKINYEIIDKNTEKLVEIYEHVSNLWDEFDSVNFDFESYEPIDKNFDEIINIISNSFLYDNQLIRKIIDKTKYVYLLSYSNIYFYWLGTKKLNKLEKNNDLNMAIKMLKISICLNKFKFNNNDETNRVIIWIPIEKERNFKHDKITSQYLKQTEDNFEAFVASGLTWGFNPRYTIITRYEEVEKLLIHELIHNFFIDGSNYHNELNDVIRKYRIEKNNSPNKNTTNKNYDYEYSIYESYTELVSTYLYLVFNNIYNKQDKSKIKNKLFSQIIIELLYSYNLICNLIKLNQYNSYEEFMETNVFEGNICKYEYYYIKALMYNNYFLTFGSELDDFKNIYLSIIKMIKQIKKNDDPVMKNIFNNHKKQLNYKYQIH